MTHENQIAPVFDRFGNRRRQNGANQSTLTFTGNNPGTPANNNRIDGYSYDTPGNMLYDGVHHYLYDAENRLISVDSGATATYVYDASGRRVYRTGYTSDTCDTTGKRDYTYDLAGRVISEYNVNGTNCIIEVYAGGRHLATQLGGTSFIHSDWLGTVRLRNTYTYPTSGYITCTSLPFGDALNCNSYIHTNHFTGKERDSESGLDNFGARYDASSMGRFMTPDPLMASAKVWDPQTWNRYAYARNNPLSYIDPTGMAEVSAAACAKDSACVTVNVNVIYDKNANGGDGLTDKQKASFEKNQLQNAKDQYGNADIHLNVSYTAGGVTSDGGKMSVSGLQAGALNVVVTDQINGAVSGVSGHTAVSFIPANGAKSDDLPHEMAHQFMGDTWSPLAHAINKDPSGILHIIDNAFTDVSNDAARGVMNNVTPHLPNYPSGAPMSIFNPQARAFQNFITPQTKPK